MTPRSALSSLLIFTLGCTSLLAVVSSTHRGAPQATNNQQPTTNNRIVFASSTRAARLDHGTVLGVTTRTSPDYKTTLTLPSRFTVDLSTDGTAFKVQDHTHDIMRIDADKNIILTRGSTLHILGSLRDLNGSYGTKGQVLTAQGGTQPPLWKSQTTLTAGDLSCDDCVNETQIEDIYVKNTGDTLTGSLRIEGHSNTQEITLVTAPNQTSSVFEIRNPADDRLFQIDANGNVTKLRNVAYSFPASQGSSNTLLQNDGSGTLTWATLGAASVTPDSLDFTEFKDSLTLDAATDIATAGFTLSTSGTGAIALNSTGAFSSAATSVRFSALSTNGLVTNTSAGVLGTLAGTSTTVLHGNASGLPTYGAVVLTTDVSGTLPVGNGGTNSTATPTAGGVGYGTGTAHAYTTAGTTGQALISGGAGSPTWYAPTAGSILYAGTSGILAQDNSNFFWDATNHRLGIGTTSPGFPLDIENSSSSNYAATLYALTPNVANGSHAGAINFGQSNGSGHLGAIALVGNASAGSEYISFATFGTSDLMRVRGDGNVYVNSSLDIGTATHGTSALAVMNGSVGIGTTTPAYPLYVTADVANSSIGSTAVFENVRTSSSFLNSFTGVTPNLGTGGHSCFGIGVAAATNNLNSLCFKYAGSGSTSNSFNIAFYGGSDLFTVLAGGNVGIGQTTPTAVLHLKAGTATVSTAPLKFTSGTNLTTAEAGAMEYDGTQLYFSPSTTRHILAQTSNATAFTAGSIPFATTSGYLSENNSKLFWDDTNFRLGIGTASPSFPLTVKGISNNIMLGLSGNNNSVALHFNSDGSGSFYSYDGTSSNNILADYSGSAQLASGGVYGWTSSATSAGGNSTTGISRLAAAKVGVGNGTSGDVSGTLVAANIGVGVSSPSAALHVLKTTEQLRLGYDTSNYASFTTSSTGNLTIAPTGTNPNIILTPSGTGAVGIGTTSPTGTGTTNVQITGNGVSGNSNYGTLSVGNPSTSTNATNGTIEFYGGSTKVSAIKSVNQSGGTNNGQLIFSVNSGGTFTNFATLDSNLGNSTSQGGFNLGLINNTVSSNLAIWNHSNNAITTGIVMGNMKSGNTSSISIDFAGVSNTSGNSGTLARIIGLKSASTDSTQLTGALAFYTTSNSLLGGTEKMRIDAGGNVVIGTAALSTSATDGFLYLPSSAGSPTGVPTSNTGTIPIEYDTTNNRLYAYRGGAWHYFAETAGFQIPNLVTDGTNETEGLAIGDLVIGKVNQQMSDGALHALYTKFDLSSEIAKTLAAHPELLTSPLLANEGAGVVTQAELETLVVNKALTIHGDASFLGNVKVAGALTRNNEKAGKATIPKGGIEVKVTYDKAFSDTPDVQVTPKGIIGREWGVVEESKEGFTIRLSKVADEKITYAWLAIQIPSDKEAQGTAIHSENQTEDVTPTPENVPAEKNTESVQVPTVTPSPALPSPTISVEPSGSPLPEVSSVPTL